MRIRLLALLTWLPMAGWAADPLLVGACTHFEQGKGLLGAEGARSALYLQ